MRLCRILGRNNIIFSHARSIAIYEFAILKAPTYTFKLEIDWSDSKSSASLHMLRFLSHSHHIVKRTHLLSRLSSTARLYTMMLRQPAGPEAARRLLDFVNASPTPFHAIQVASARLDKAGFEKVVYPCILVLFPHILRCA